MSDTKQHKAKFLFLDKNGCSIIKGFVQEYSDGSDPRYFLYGLNNLKNINHEIKDRILREGVGTLEKLKDLIPSFKLCILDYGLKNTINSEYIDYHDNKQYNTLHITVEPWIINKLKEITDGKLEEYNNLMNTNKNKFGVIQPSMSLTINEILLKYFLEEDKNNE